MPEIPLKHYTLYNKNFYFLAVQNHVLAFSAIVIIYSGSYEDVRNERDLKNSEMTMKKKIFLQSKLPLIGKHF